MVSNPYYVRTHSFSDSNQKETHSLDFRTGIDSSTPIGIPGGEFGGALNALRQSYEELLPKRTKQEQELLKAALTSFQEAALTSFQEEFTKDHEKANTKSDNAAAAPHQAAAADSQDYIVTSKADSREKDTGQNNLMVNPVKQRKGEKKKIKPKPKNALEARLAGIRSSTNESSEDDSPDTDNDGPDTDTNGSDCVWRPLSPRPPTPPPPSSLGAGVLESTPRPPPPPPPPPPPGDKPRPPPPPPGTELPTAGSQTGGGESAGKQGGTTSRRINTRSNEQVSKAPGFQDELKKKFALQAKEEEVRLPHQAHKEPALQVGHQPNERENPGSIERSNALDNMAGIDILRRKNDAFQAARALESEGEWGEEETQSDKQSSVVSSIQIEHKKMMMIPARTLRPRSEVGRAVQVSKPLDMVGELEQKMAALRKKADNLLLRQANQEPAEQSNKGSELKVGEKDLQAEAVEKMQKVYDEAKSQGRWRSNPWKRIFETLEYRNVNNTEKFQLGLKNLRRDFGTPPVQEVMELLGKPDMIKSTCKAVKAAADEIFPPEEERMERDANRRI